MSVFIGVLVFALVCSALLLGTTIGQRAQERRTPPADDDRAWMTGGRAQDPAPWPASRDGWYDGGFVARAPDGRIVDPRAAPPPPATAEPGDCGCGEH